MEVDSVVIIAILSVSYITTRIVKTQTSLAKIPRVPVENQITTLSVVKIAIKFSPCSIIKRVDCFPFRISQLFNFLQSTCVLCTFEFFWYANNFKPPFFALNLRATSNLTYEEVRKSQKLRNSESRRDDIKALFVVVLPHPTVRQ